MLAIVCPGQGAQTPGMFTHWLEIPVFAQTIDELGSASGVSLLKHGTQSDADTIRDTAIALRLEILLDVALPFEQQVKLASLELLAIRLVRLPLRLARVF